VKTHLPEAPPAWDGITIFHLLTHTAGFPGLQSPVAGRQPPVDSADGTVAGFVAALMRRPLESPPGERFNYTDSACTSGRSTAAGSPHTAAARRRTPT
jgi:CubicO group peptidase (beta-lactamase class C family)